MEATRFENFSDFRSNGGPGSYLFTGQQDVEGKTGMMFKCPGCGGESFLQFEGHGPQPNWSWNGNEDKPTLHPSLHSVGCCGWHGYLTDGVFKSV